MSKEEREKMKSTINKVKQLDTVDMRLVDVIVTALLARCALTAPTEAERGSA